jgi:hypothetical protein
MKDFYLFPGAHKTGTTLLQAALHGQAERLEPHGIKVIPRTAFYSSPLFYYLKSLRPGAKPVDRNLRKNARQWAREIRGTDSKLILSGESCFGEPNSQPYPGITTALETLSEMFPRRRIRITYYVRRQDSFFESVYIQRIQKGALPVFDKFYRATYRANYDWCSMLDTMAQTIGRRNIVIKPFEMIQWGPDNYVRDFFSCFVKDERLMEEVSKLPTTTNTNVSLSQYALDEALRKFPDLDADGRKKLIRELQREAANSNHQRAQLLSEERREQIAKKYSGANEKLFSKWQLDERFRPYYTFSDTKPPAPSERPSSTPSQIRAHAGAKAPRQPKLTAT